MCFRPTAVIAAALGLCLGGAASAQAYLAPGATPDATRYLPPAPAKGSKADAADRAEVRSAARLKDSPRWKLAQGDAVISPEAILQDYSCALGVTPTPQAEPTLFAIYGEMLKEVRPVIDPPKNLYARRRPYIGTKATICVEHSPDLDESGSYPSGHSTVGWSAALILSELAPDRATQVLSRGRAYGESRVVCGVHFPSDVDAGRTNASAFVAVLHSSPQFRADMDKARAELDAARRAGPAPAECAVPDAAAARQPW
jgi:acid phosphatase (class A)